jgi:hypothetical protein
MNQKPDTRTVKVYDMRTGALLRVTTTAEEARRAASLPTAGMTIADVLAGRKPTPAQVKARTAQALRNAERLALAEAQSEANAEVARIIAEVPFTVYSDLNTAWQAGYDY